MPDSIASWPARLAQMEAEQSGDNPEMPTAKTPRCEAREARAGEWCGLPPASLEHAYCAGWGACREFLPREPPEGLSAEERELWLEGWSNAYDTPLDRGLSVDDLMRVGVL